MERGRGEVNLSPEIINLGFWDETRGGEVLASRIIYTPHDPKGSAD